MPKKNTDPLRGLDASLDAEHSAVAKRFRDAERFTQGLPEAASISKDIAPPSSPAAASRSTVRDAFSFPVDDHAKIRELQARCIAGGWSATKSEIVRAGLYALAGLNDATFRRTLDGLEKLKPGRAGRA